jgi:hypothetical protein
VSQLLDRRKWAWTLALQTATNLLHHVGRNENVTLLLKLKNVYDDHNSSHACEPMSLDRYEDIVSRMFGVCKENDNVHASTQIESGTTHREYTM